MRESYTNLNIQIVLGSDAFTALNIVRGLLERPIPLHSHGKESYELHYIYSGRGTLYAQNTSYPLSANMLYMTGPCIEHAQFPEPSDPLTECCIYFKVQELHASEDPVSTRFVDTPFWVGTDSEQMSQLFDRIFFELAHKYRGYMTQVKALLQQCIVGMVRNYEANTPASRHFSQSSLIDSKCFLVETSFLGEAEAITLTELAAKLGLSPRQTQRFFKEYYGKTFQQKKLEAKMVRAKQLLDDSGLSVSEIAWQLHYASPAHFSDAFKRCYGISPSQYRKEPRAGRPG